MTKEKCIDCVLFNAHERKGTGRYVYDEWLKPTDLCLAGHTPRFRYWDDQLRQKRLKDFMEIS